MGKTENRKQAEKTIKLMMDELERMCSKEDGPDYGSYLRWVHDESWRKLEAHWKKTRT